jgi:hypothetical protein
MTGTTSSTLALLPSPIQAVWQLGPIPLRAYAFCLLLGIVAAMVITERRLRSRDGTDVNPDRESPGSTSHGTPLWLKVSTVMVGILTVPVAVMVPTVPGSDHGLGLHTGLGPLASADAAGFRRPGDPAGPRTRVGSQR